MVKIATWNVNSIKARLPNVIEWLKTASPDVALLQELKTQTEAFPYLELEELGYNFAVHGQKTYNGVAILSKFPIEDMQTSLPGDREDTQARYIEGLILADEAVIRVASIYVPNGGEVGSDKFQYKLRFFDRLAAHVETLLSYDEMLVLGGDYNVAPEVLDVYDPVHLKGTTCFHPDEQKKYRTLLYKGLIDCYRTCHPDRQEFSWWDYRGGGWEHNKGMRIDHLLLSPQAADRVSRCEIDGETRGHTKASDHAPVWCELNLTKKP